eukprot:CAMPEP_0183457472 /NCGR_PEP_ID=MMETSP0370-20130417/131396_1 /TAXON_ID=268820 /ORGANISM="Peridinium aciculiferum, Strain PAER-2" /LENGTH=57 /DNA_ID=CAMNT_0025649191 /DNA_START=62 /DNA_END=232 /DNA_ORIENTATION=-
MARRAVYSAALSFHSKALKLWTPRVDPTMTAERWIPDATIALTISGFLLMTSHIEAR